MSIFQICALLKKKHALSPRASAADILAQPVARHAVPLDLLPRHRKLSSQTLERSLAEAHEALVQLLLVLSLCCGNLLDDSGAVDGRDGAVDGLVGQETDVSVLVVVHVDFKGALEGAG